MKDMVEKQDGFKETLDMLMQSINGFPTTFNKLENYAEAAQAVTDINARLAESVNDMKMYNNQEMMCGLPITNYDEIASMKKQFEPFSDLWLTTRTWFEKSVSWTSGAWEELDPVDLDETFGDILKVISRSKSKFTDKDGLEAILNVASAVKEQVDKFKPVVPVAIALRKEGMVDRHWDSISKDLGSDIRPIEGFTLQSCIDAGLLEHSELCEDVGEKAYKEFNIEKSLAKMKGEWVG